MKGLTEREAEILRDCTSAFDPTNVDENQCIDDHPGVRVVVEALVARRLLTPLLHSWIEQRSDGIYRVSGTVFHTTPLGRLALELDAAFRMVA